MAHVYQRLLRQAPCAPPTQLWYEEGQMGEPPPPIFIILGRDCILERMPLKEGMMLHTSTSVQPAPLAMRLRREAVCTRQAMLMTRRRAAPCLHCPTWAIADQRPRPNS